MYEPETDGSDSNQEMDRDFSDNERLTNSDWCTCGQCRSLDTVVECRCCCESERIRSTMEGIDDQIQCITEHPGFRSACCDIWVLQIAYFQYRQEYGERDLNGEAVNRRYRYIAYRQFVRWCWGFLGRNVRVPLPACVVLKVRAAFPSQEHSGFRYPQL